MTTFGDAVMTEHDFDQWRHDYDTLSLTDQKRFYERCAAVYPDQRSFNLKQARRFFDRYQPRTVIELGGWDGALAHTILAEDDLVVSWRNYDLVRVPQVCESPAYELTVLGRWLWDYESLKADAFVCSHTLEHIRFEQWHKLMEKVDARAVYLEAPLALEGQAWDGYMGSHIFEKGWNAVDSWMVWFGYERAYRWMHGRFYERV